MNDNKEIKKQSHDPEKQGSEEVCAEDELEPVCDTLDGKVIFGEEESWLPVETKLVAGSLIAGMTTLIILAVLVHLFLLGG